MKNKILHLFIYFVLLFGLFFQTVYAEEVYIETKKGEVEKIPIAVVIASDDQELKSAVRRILLNDLERSLFFNLISIDGLKVNGIPNRVNEGMRGQLTASGAEALVVAQVVRDGEQIRMEGKLYETGSGELVYSKKYIGNNNILRRIVHRFSDEIVFRMSGEKGIAQTRIVYVSDQTGRKELYIMDYDGYSSKMITGNRSINISPDWSPAGAHISYT